MEAAKAAKVNTEEVMKIRGVTRVIPDALRRRRDRRDGAGDAERPTRAQGRLGLLRFAGEDFDSAQAKAECYARHGKDPNTGAGMPFQGRRVESARGRARNSSRPSIFRARATRRWSP